MKAKQMINNESFRTSAGWCTRFIHHYKLIFHAHLTNKVKQYTAHSHNIDITIINFGGGSSIAIFDGHLMCPSILLILVSLMCRYDSSGLIGPRNRCVLYADVTYTRVYTVVSCLIHNLFTTHWIWEIEYLCSVIMLSSYFSNSDLLMYV